MLFEENVEVLLGDANQCRVSHGTHRGRTWFIGHQGNFTDDFTPAEIANDLFAPFGRDADAQAARGDEKQRVAQRLASRLDGDGWIRIAASDTRSQRQNRLLAEQRLASLVARALHVRKKRIKTAPTASSKEERLRVKKLRSRRKRERGSGDYE